VPYSSKEDAIDGAIKTGKEIEKQLMNMKASYFEKKPDNYSIKVTYHNDVPYYESIKKYTSPGMITKDEIDKFEEAINEYHEDTIKNLLNAYENSASHYKKLLSTIKSGSKTYKTMTNEMFYGKKQIPPLPISYNEYKSLYPMNFDEFMKDFTSSHSMKKSNYIKLVSSHPVTSLGLPSLPIPKSQLYINAELFEYIRQLANNGTLGFWDLFKLQQTHDFPLIDDIKETPEPSDDMIYQITI